MSSFLRRVQRRSLRKLGYTRSAIDGRILGPNGEPVGRHYPKKALPEHFETVEENAA